MRGASRKGREGGQSLVTGGSSLVIIRRKGRAIPCNWRVLPCNIRRKGCAIPCNWRALPCNIRRKSGASSPRTKHMTRRCSGGNRSISARPNAAHTRTGHHGRHVPSARPTPPTTRVARGRKLRNAGCAHCMLMPHCSVTMLFCSLRARGSGVRPGSSRYIRVSVLYRPRS